MRKLASIRRITDIKPIENADAIVCAYVDGWPVVIKLNEYEVGDLVVYCEIDSWIPHDIAPFLSKGKEPRIYEGITGERLRTVKLRGQISQGLILPLSILGETTFREDDDVSEYLKITKYEKPLPACLSGMARGNFPTFVPKTNEERIQNSPELLVGLSDIYITEKLDGTSFTAYYNDGVFGVCSRNLDLKETEGNSHWNLARKLALEEKMASFGKNLAIQGEMIGSAIQGNLYKLNDHKLYLFNLYWIDEREYGTMDELLDVATLLNLDVVPILPTPNNEDIPKTVSDMLLYAEGRSKLYDVEREGIVVRTRDSKISFKAISNKWLLKYDN